ncbi:hypothetical protein [Ureibacillus sp. FSL K6-3587]|uniref:hypothetical protein n=1 Tax=Ureibacillus sp. FSL K6-3587 TaxID=2954681 RepID=UPI003158BD4D
MKASHLTFSLTLANRLGVDAAIVLQRLHEELLQCQTKFNGHRWFPHTYEEWRGKFPFWSKDKIVRIILRLEQEGFIISTNELNDDPLNRTKWYRIHYELIATLGKDIFPDTVPSEEKNVNASTGNGQMPFAKSEIGFSEDGLYKKENPLAKNAHPNSNAKDGFSTDALCKKENPLAENVHPCSNSKDGFSTDALCQPDNPLTGNAHASSNAKDGFSTDALCQLAEEANPPLTGNANPFPNPKNGFSINALCQSKPHYPLTEITSVSRFSNNGKSSVAKCENASSEMAKKANGSALAQSQQADIEQYHFITQAFSNYLNKNTSYSNNLIIKS